MNIQTYLMLLFTIENYQEAGNIISSTYPEEKI